MLWKTLLVSCVLWVAGSCGDLEDCDQLEKKTFSPVLAELLNNNFTLRRVDQTNGMDSEECLNMEQSSSPPPCSTLQYALHESENTSVGLEVGSLRVELGPGVYRSVGESNKIINSYNISIVGAGVSRTWFVCGVNGTADRPCDYRNFQIINSTRILVANATFTGCGPITSSFYIGKSDFIFIDGCSFEDTTSPALLIFNSPNVRVTETVFRNNTPDELDEDIVRNTCYFSGGDPDSFFLDNRTTSGGISLFSRGLLTNLHVENCYFIDNAARNDTAVILVRRSNRNGNSGALNVRLLNSMDSTVCIRRSKFINNTAEAHAGALAISLSGSSTRNKFVVAESLFDGNKCEINKCTGGAVGIDLHSITRYNTFSFLESNFTRNEATSSGAIVLATSASAEVSDEGLSDALRLRNCWFLSNMAFFEGTALGVFSIAQTNQIGIHVDILNCHFHENQASGGSGDTTAVTAYRVLLVLRGNNTFLGNQGGGTSLLSSRMDVKGHVLFDRNVAVFGAGVAMAGRSQILLHENSSAIFSNNFASEGAGLYVEYSSSDFVLSVLNTGCFIRYNSTAADLPPTRWKTRMTFVNNTAVAAGAAIFANDMSRCRWLGGLSGDRTIFEITEEGTPFLFTGNRLMNVSAALGGVANQTLATDPSSITAKSKVEDVSYGEEVTFYLSAQDQFRNFREAVWSVEAPAQQRLGSLSTDQTAFSYTVPGKQQFPEASGDTATSFSVSFSLLQSQQAEESSAELQLTGCHPGYTFNNDTQLCECDITQGGVVRCDQNRRYFYSQDGFWVGVQNDTGQPFFANTIPGFLNCTSLGTLQGCLYKFDAPDEQCASGRKGMLCGDCQPGHGVTFDLRFCESNCGPWGIILFIVICIITPILSLALLYFDFPIPNELKGVIFYAQVIGVIYRSTPYLFEGTGTVSGRFLDFLVNMFGFAMPFPLCLHQELPVVAVAFLGYVPPLLAIITAFAYALCAKHVKQLSHREHYGFHGFHFLFLFIFKYFVDTSFIFVSCTSVNGDSVFLYQGTQRCQEFPFILLVVFGSVVLVLLGIVLPIYVLKLIYAPQKMIYVRNAFTHGLKNGRRYLWYGVWDIWRRLLFVGANLFISITTRSVVLFIHSMLIMLCLTVLCLVKPYKKYHINVMEGLVILALFSTTLSIYDRDNDFHVGSTVGAVGLIFPFLYGGLFIIFKIGMVLFKKLWPKVEERWHAGERLGKTSLATHWKSLRHFTEEFFMGEEKAKERAEQEDMDEVWRLEVIQPMRKASDSAEVEESYNPDLRETLLED